jgi:predicted ATPase/DNA-binding SARP family transcriptional activator
MLPAHQLAGVLGEDLEEVPFDGLVCRVKAHVLSLRRRHLRMSNVVPSTSRVNEFQVLGPVQAVRSGFQVQLGGRRQRWLLALLLVEPGRALSSDRLIDELWQGDPPRRAEATLRVYVSRLRSALGDTMLVARPPGYVLDIEPELLDARRFERLCREGREALARGAAGMAADRLAAALALWHGPAFADVRDGGLLAHEAGRLDELRMAAREDRIDAELSLGRHTALVPELEGLVAVEPLRERLWRQLVLALYHSQRQADALAAYERARTILSRSLGLDPSQELQALERAVLRQDVAPASTAVQRHNLPAPLTNFVGREDETADIAELLRLHRLVTLTGVGGAGKTRLALEAAAAQVGAWTGGIWLIDLAAYADPRMTVSAVARVLGVTDRPDVSALAGLVEHLRGEELLIVLDNCEHLASACAELVHEVLRGSPWVRVLATSRVPLGVPGEVEYPVEPLPTPPDDLSGDEVAQFASVRLFLERGRAVRRDLATTASEMKTVARICRELDGLPLAIELAAARARALSIDDISGRLDDRLGFLHSRRSLVAARHQTLRATIDWSYELLGIDERELLSALSVFSGGFTLDSVAAVCTNGDVARADELVSRLVDNSLVVVRRPLGAARYGQLQTIREYSAERLAASGAREELHRSHALHFLEFAEHTWTEDRERKVHALELFDQERDNLHSAMRWTLDSGSNLAVPMAAALWRYWLVRGYRRQGLEWLEQALRLPAGAPGPPRAIALAGAALLARLLGDLSGAGLLAHEGVSLGRAVGPPRALTVSLNVLTTLAARADDFERARRHCEESMAVARAVRDVRLEAMALFVFAEGLLHGERYADVRDVGGQALDLARSTGDPEVIALVLARLGIAAAHEHRLDEAAQHLTEAVRHARSLGFPDTAAWCCEGLALVAAHRGDYGRAARLLGAGESLRRAAGSAVQPAEAAAREATMSALDRALTGEQLQAALEAGRGLNLDDATSEALTAARAM